jgi:hypothetical protein
VTRNDRELVGNDDEALIDHRGGHIGGDAASGGRSSSASSSSDSVPGRGGADLARGRRSGQPMVPPSLVATARGEGQAARGEERGAEFEEGNGGLGFGSALLCVFSEK